MALINIAMPLLGESVHEGTVSRWLVSSGDSIQEFQPIVEVDTDKVNTEVPSPVTGVIKEITASAGETVTVGTTIAIVEVDVDSEKHPGTAVKSVATEDKNNEPDAADPRGRTVRSTPNKVEIPRAPSSLEGTAHDATGSSARHLYSPSVQQLAHEHRIDLAQIQGTGVGGRVTKKDALKFIEGGQNLAPVTNEPSTATLAPIRAAVDEADRDTVVPLTRMRRLIAERMSHSKATIPHASQTQEVDMSGVVANRAHHQTGFKNTEGFALTYLPYVIAATAAALREHPGVNATFSPTQIVVHRDINIGVSIGLEDTLVVPVIRRADNLSIVGIARKVHDFANAVRTHRMQADDFVGGTFTVNNSGTFGTLFSYAVINPGQAGILTMGAIQQRPVVVNGMIGIKALMYLSFSLDHRILDGLAAARFLTSCRRFLEAVTEEASIF